VSFGDDLYEAMSPLAEADADQGYALQAFCEAIGVPFEWVVTYALDQASGIVGWSLLMSPWTCPVEGLPWLAQFVGVSTNTSYTEAQLRLQVAAHAGYNRGTPDAIELAAQGTLTGRRQVFLSERLDGDVWQLGAITYAAETPDPDATLAAIESQTPAGIKVAYSIETWDYTVIKAQNATYTALAAAYPDYTSLLAGGA
jgi:hypothetical protein